jgi:hypothetical protein
VTATTIESPSKPTNPGLLVSLLLIGGANSVLFSVMPPAGRHLGFVEWQIGLIVAFSAAASIAVGAREQGAAAGLVAAAQAGGFLVGPLLFAVLYQFAPASPFFVGIGIAVLLFLLALSRKPAAT